jgi:pimeloyl-ACP methyl ester carboxylesterase
MKRYMYPIFTILLLVGGLLAVTGTSTAHAAAMARSSCSLSSGTNTLQGTLGGANYTIAVPSHWNGTLALYSHGYVPASAPLLNPAPDAPDQLTAGKLLQEGYALAGSSYSQNGWALQQAFHDDIALLDYFDRTCGHPVRTVAWGDSMGGMITAGLVQLDPQRFAGALPMCGLLSGSIGLFNLQLDGLFAFNLLLANGSLQVVNFTDPTDELNQAEGILAASQQTPQGRARIALFSSLEDVPGWFTPTSPEPAPNDYATQEQNQYLAAQVDLFFDIVAMAEAEGRAGGNYSWNTGVNYFDQFRRSIDRQEVKALYQQAGLNLQQDLDVIQEAPRISADQSAVRYMEKYIIFNGDLDIPVLSMHTTGDPLVFNQVEQAYVSVVNAAGDASLLRQVFVHRAGHCAFTPAENLTAFHTLIRRLNTGRWFDMTDPDLMDQEANAYGPTYNVLPPSATVVPPAFTTYHPAVFLRPFDARKL